MDISSNKPTRQQGRPQLRRDRNNNPNPPKSAKHQYLLKESQLQPYVTDPADIPEAFLNIWLECPSFTPILKQYDGRGWYSLTAKSKKRVPLTREQLVKAYTGQSPIIGARFGKYTNRVVIDIDKNSQYHPSINGLKAWKPILDALASIGLLKNLPFCSSHSGGYHLSFPLPCHQRTWTIARLVKKTLKRHGIIVQPGICEVFPNTKAYNSDYNAIRLPKQRNDSYLVDDELRRVDCSFEEFVQLWHAAAASQSIQLNPELNQHEQQPELEFTTPGETNSILGRLANYGDRYLNIKKVSELGQWIQNAVAKLPGYEKYVSTDSKIDIEDKDWCWRWAKSHVKSRTRYLVKKRTTAGDYHLEKSKEAKERLKNVINTIIQEYGDVTHLVFKSLNKLRLTIIEVGKDLHGIGFGKTFLEKNKSLWATLLNPPEFKNSSEKNSSEASAAPKPPPNVINAKVGATLVQSGVEACPQLDLLDLDVATHSSTTRVLKKGDTVRIHLPGTCLDQKEIEIRGAARDALKRRVYRLNLRLAGCWHILPLESLQLVSTRSQAANIQPERVSISPTTPTELVLSDSDIRRLAIPKDHWLNALSGGCHRVRQEEVKPKIWQLLLSSVRQKPS